MKGSGQGPGVERAGELDLPGGVQETLQVAFGNFRQTGRHVVQLAFAHPTLQLVHQVEQVFEGVDREQQRLLVVDLRTLVDDPFHL